MNRKLVLPDDWKAYFLKFLQARKRTGQFPAYPPHLDLELSESNVFVFAPGSIGIFRSSSQTSAQKRRDSIGTCGTLNAQTAMSFLADNDTS